VPRGSNRQGGPRKTKRGSKPAAKRRSGRKRAGSAGRSTQRPAPKKRGRSNKRTGGGNPRGVEPKKQLEPEERKARNRTYLFLAILALINAYVLVWRGEGSISEFDMQATAIGGASQSGFAAPPEDVCSGDPVRIFDRTEKLIEQRTRLSEGRTLRLGLLGVGVEGAAIDEIELAVREKYDLSLLAGSGAPLRVAADGSGRVHALEVELAEGHLVQACRKDGRLLVRNIEHALRADVAVVALTLESGGLGEAVVQANEHPELAKLVAKRLAWDVDFHTEARPGDRVQLIVEKRYLGPHFHRYGRVLAVRYIGAAGRVAYYRYKLEGSPGGFYDREGAPMKRELLRTPVGWYPVARADLGRLPPKIEFVEGRMGAIYHRAAGAPVVALGDGTITKIRRDSEDGLSVELEVGSRTLRYMHLGRLFGDVEEGQKLRQGQIIGLVGTSGRAPAPRLRLELLVGDEVIDPMIVHNRGEGRSPRIGDPVPEKSRERFSKDIRPWSRSLRQAGR
jgi:hypothetical protein